MLYFNRFDVSAGIVLKQSHYFAWGNYLSLPLLSWDKF